MIPNGIMPEQIKIPTEAEVDALFLFKAEHYKILSKEVAKKKKQLAELSKQLKEFVAIRGEDEEGSKRVTLGDYVVKVIPREIKVGFDEKSFIEHLKRVGLTPAVARVEAVDWEMVEDFLSTGELQQEDIDKFYETKDSPLLNIQNKLVKDDNGVVEDMPEIEVGEVFCP